MKSEPERTDVVIVGAGFTGLSAALELKAAGIDFIVLEARDRVGGRVESRRNGLGEQVDSGGQFICDDMPEVMALARSRGKTLVRAYAEGDFVAQPPMSAGEGARTYGASVAIRERMNAIAPDDPAIAGLSVAAWLARQDDPDAAKAAFRAMIEGLWCHALERLPLWYLIDNDRRITNEVTELQYLLAETMHSLADDLASDLGRRLRLGSAVARVEQGPNGVRVVTDAGSIAATSVLIAVPPVMASKIAFSPPLPTPLAKALGVWRSGMVIKIQLRYASAFWREKGQSGIVIWREPSGFFACDVSKDAGHPALAFFVGGPLARSWGDFDDATLCAEVKSRLVAALGKEASDTIDFGFRIWTDDRWSGGGYADLILDMAATDAESVLLAGSPPVHFASSELSPSFPGYVEGAIVAGRIAARKMIAEFQSAIATSASGS